MAGSCSRCGKAWMGRFPSAVATRGVITRVPCRALRSPRYATTLLRCLPTMPRPIRAHIDLAAMRHNLRRARSRAAGRKIWAVIKANAYGHGIERAVLGFADADGLALIDFDEARRARAARWTGPILMLEGCFEAGDVAICRELDLGVVVHDESQLRMLEQAPAGPPIGVFVKVNTGMNRLGVEPSQLASVHARLVQCPAARLDGLTMHFANAERADRHAGPAAVNEQLARFEVACRGIDLP